MIKIKVFRTSKKNVYSMKSEENFFIFLKAL
jgi:hypothetical protein